jgi:hypothetical protein
MSRMNPSPLGGDMEARAGVEIPAKRDDVHPRSLPEDRSEGNLNRDPVLECGMCGSYMARSPSGESEDDDGAGNPSPRTEEMHYGSDDEEEDEMGGPRPAASRSEEEGGDTAPPDWSGRQD